MARKRKRDNRTQYILIFQDLYNVNRFGGLLPAQSLENAEFIAECLNGMIIGEIDRETGDEFYYEEKIEELNRHTDEDTWIS